MFKKDWVKELKRLSVSKGSDHTKMEITPFRDWRIIVTLFFVGLLVSIGFNFYMSIEINRDSFFTTAPKSGEVVVFNKDGLSKVLAALAEKEALFEKARTEKSTVVDPSR